MSDGGGFFHLPHGEGHSHFPHHHQGHVDPPSRRSNLEVTGDVLKIYCEADPDFNLAVRNHEVVLVPADDNDPYQTWIRDESWSTKVKDSAGFPAFALINRGTGKALSHTLQPEVPVSLEEYEPDVVNEVILWTASKDVGNGFKAIRPVSNIHLNLDADHASKKYGGVKDGNKVILFKWKDEPNQHWHLVSIAHTRDFQSRPQAMGYPGHGSHLRPQDLQFDVNRPQEFQFDHHGDRPPQPYGYDHHGARPQEYGRFDHHEAPPQEYDRFDHHGAPPQAYGFDHHSRPNERGPDHHGRRDHHEI